jgi:ABC-type amino acid transport substrate-binding protein
MPSSPTALRPRRRLGLAPAVASLLAGLAACPPLSAQTPDPAPVRLATNLDRTYFPPVEALLRKAYAGISQPVEFVPWPLPRAQVELKAGHLDGVAMRVEAYFEQTPFVRKVDVPLLTLSVYAFARPPCPARLAPEELAKAKVSYQRGMVAAEALLPESARVPANTPSDVFLNLSSGAADYALLLTTPWMSELPVQTRVGAVCRIEAPLGRTQLFHGVHESHAAWVAPLEQALRRLRDRGEIQQAWADYERQMTSEAQGLQAQPGRSLTIVPAAPASAASRPGP